MAVRILLAPQLTNRAAGLEPTLTVVIAEGISFANSRDDLFFVVTNAGIASATLTIPTPLTVDGKAVADATITVGAGKTLYVGPFPPAVYNQATGLVHVDSSNNTDVSIAVLRPGSVAY
jgi:hypothetical protein